ncbi:hypothetical protein BASA81_001240 [Batrachochytrium salamandrivorans]|nr:hypothetical protein BASA81_001240 [Batrachochytrium salamandrivorans]
MTLLWKRNANGAKSLWKIFSQNNVICVEWGLETGKMQHVNRTIMAGKQGRSVEEQMKMEMDALIKEKKSKHGYLEDVVDEGGNETTAPVLPPLPMLAQPWPKNFAARLKGHDHVFIQPKLDGLRCLADLHTGVLYSRARNPFTSLGHITKDLANLKVDHGVRYLDGEVYAHGMEFQSITSQARSAQPRKENSKLKLHVFDCIHGELDFSARYQLLRSVFATAGDSAPAITLCEAVKKPIADVDFDGEIRHYMEQGYEGAMVRLPTGPYQSGVRSKNLYKLKSFSQEEYKVLRFQKHSELDTLGSVLLQVAPDSDLTFGATPATSAEAKLDLWVNRALYANGDFVATVKFQNLSKDQIPRFPVLVGLRHKDDC